MHSAPPPSGHLSSNLREPFCELVELARYGLDDSQQQQMRRLTGQLWNCTDTLPGAYCDELALPRGSTYAQAARAWRSRV